MRELIITLDVPNNEAAVFIPAHAPWHKIEGVKGYKILGIAPDGNERAVSMLLNVDDSFNPNTLDWSAALEWPNVRLQPVTASREIAGGPQSVNAGAGDTAQFGVIGGEA